MRIAGIIAEYNPFHLGHAYQIEKTRELGVTHVVCVMSGHFVQRGEPAVFQKAARVKAALSAGADLVIELPLPWAMAPAQTFARGGVALLAVSYTHLDVYKRQTPASSPFIRARWYARTAGSWTSSAPPSKADMGKRKRCRRG